MTEQIKLKRETYDAFIKRESDFTKLRADYDTIVRNISSNQTILNRVGINIIDTETKKPFSLGGRLIGDAAVYVAHTDTTMVSVTITAKFRD